VERAFKSTGLELADYEQVVVDPDSKMEQEASGEVLEYFLFLHLWKFLGRRNLCTRTAREMSVNVSLVSMDLGYASMCLDILLRSLSEYLGSHSQHMQQCWLFQPSQGMNIRWCQRGVQNMMILGVQLIPKVGKDVRFL